MRMVDEFVERVLRDEGSFILTSRDTEKSRKQYAFMQMSVGKARYIFGSYDWDEDANHFAVRLRLQKPELVAIVSDGIVYITNEFFFNVWRPEPVLPDRAELYSTKAKQVNEQAINTVFLKFYNRLSVNELSDHSCKVTARTLLFSKTSLINISKPELFRDEDVAKLLCGFIDLEEEARKKLTEEMDFWLHEKAFNEKVKELMQAEETAESWEIELAKGLNSVDAKTVTVSFEKNGKTACLKIDPQRILDKMPLCEGFSTYDFAVAERTAEAAFEEMDVDTYYSYSNNNTLNCKHITKITYRKKELYVRK